LYDDNLYMKSSLIPAFLFFCLVMTSLTACRTAPVPDSAPGDIEPAAAASADIQEPLDIDWAGTTWIQPVSGGRPGDFPVYRGIHLGRDGRLILINMDQAAGDRWTAGPADRTVTFSLLQGNPSFPLAGTFQAFTETAVPPEALRSSASGTASAIRLVSAGQPSTQGIVLYQAGVNVDIVENHWIPRTLRGGDGVPWPMNREIHLMVLPETAGMGVLGFGGENRFRGSLALDAEKFVAGPLAITRKYGPASVFEDLYVRMISETDRYVQVGDDLFLYRETRPTASFQVRLFD
jgi:hypothetical protein